MMLHELRTKLRELAEAEAEWRRAAASGLFQQDYLDKLFEKIQQLRQQEV